MSFRSNLSVNILNLFSDIVFCSFSMGTYHFKLTCIQGIIDFVTVFDAILTSRQTREYGGPQRQYTNIYYITALYILVHKHIHWLRGYIYQYNKIYTSTTILYPSTEMLISVQKYKLQYGKISPILSTQITAPVKKISISQYKT